MVFIFFIYPFRCCDAKRHSLEADMGVEIEGDGRACISSIRSRQSRQPEKLHLSLQQYQLLNKAHKTRYASKSSHNIHKTSLKDNSKKAKFDRNVVKGARAARIQQNKW
ncbi:unnamed protein product [Camellia sinensis]